MSQQRQYNDTSLTKIFVGGLAWETQRETMKSYFDQFGEIIEAVVITDKITGRSKGYGFVTFKDPEAAVRACQNPSPVIDGRRANCNIASLGAQKPPPPNPRHGSGRFRPATGLTASATPYHGSSSSYIHHTPSQYTFPYSTYGYTGYSPETIYPMNYYGVYGGQQFSPYYYSTGSSGTTEIFQNFYPIYARYPHSSQQAHGFRAHQYSHMVQYPYVHPFYGTTGGLLSLPSTTSMQATNTGATSTMTTAAVMATTITRPPPPSPSIPPSTIATTVLVGSRTGSLQASVTPS